MMISILFFAVTICWGHGDIHAEGKAGEEGHAFLLTLAAGLCTVIGAAVAFCLKPEDVERERSPVLGGSLAFAAAVMLYVSFIEIWPESLSHYEMIDADNHDSHDHDSHDHHSHDSHVSDSHEDDHNGTDSHEDDHSHSHEDDHSHSHDHDSHEHDHDSHEEEKEDYQLAHFYTTLTFFFGIFLGFLCNRCVRLFENRKGNGAVPPAQQKDVEIQLEGKNTTDPTKDDDSSVIKVVDDTERKMRLMRAGLVTAISIALHNFPEGIVTFLAAVVNWQLGVATAFAIAMHNIPEGISIAIPYYYATESRWKAFAIALLSGLAEPLGALIGWAILGDDIDNDVYAFMFGVTAGVMVYISFCELLPLARRNDPEDKVTTICIFLGMFVMDLSLFIAS